MNKKRTIAVIVVLVIIIIVGVLVYKNNNKVNNQANVVSTTTNLGYVDQVGKFGLNLPAGWTKVTQNVATSSSDTWFANPTAPEDEKGASILVRRFARTEDMNTLISKIGGNVFLDLIVESTKQSINKYAIVATTTQDINGVTYKITQATYEGLDSKRQATQFLFLTLTEDAYYLIGVDVYTDLLPKLEQPLLNSIKSFQILK
jgi:hypothetical protein